MSSRPVDRLRGHSAGFFRDNGRRGRALRRASFVESLENRLYLSAAAYTWQNANIGAGGFVDGIFYDPHNANTIYARTDIGGLYKTVNDGGNWTQLLDFVGNNTTGSGNGTQSQEIGVLGFAIDPENSNNLYANVGEYSGTNGAVFYSTDGGQTWGQTNLSFYVGGNSNGRGDGEQIAVDPNDSNIVFLGSNNAGLWESTNAGHSFTQISSAYSARPARRSLFHSNRNSGKSQPDNLCRNQFDLVRHKSLYDEQWRSLLVAGNRNRDTADRLSSRPCRAFRRKPIPGLCQW